MKIFAYFYTLKTQLQQKMDPNEKGDILNLLISKSANKQHVYRTTLEVFNETKQILHDLQITLTPLLAKIDPTVEIKYSNAGSFEVQFKFAGDTLVFMMHTNVFSFPENHYIQSSPYVKNDKQNIYCGLIQVYNFLSDSIKYNRQDDIGELIARIYVNRERQFFIEGKRPINIQHNNFGEELLTNEKLKQIIDQSILYCLNFDLLMPPMELVQQITVDMKNYQSYSSGFATSKSVGFEIRSQLDNNTKGN